MYLFRTSSLSARIAWRIAVLSGIAIAGLITSVVGTAVIAVLNAQNDTHHAVHELSNRLETFLTRAETDLLVTAYSYDRSVLPEMTLRDILDRNAAVLTVAVLDHASGEVLHARQRVGLVDEATMLATVEAMPEPGWGEVYFNERNLPLIDMNVPVNRALDSKSAPIVLVATLDLSGLWDEVRNLDLSSGGYAYVVDRSGQVLVSPDMTQVRAATHAPDYVLSTPDDTGRHLLDQKIYAGLRGNRVLAEVEQLEMIPWYLVIEQPVFAVLDGLYMVIALTVGLIVTVLLVVTSTGRFMFQRVVMPLNILRGHIEEFRMGNMNQRIYLARQSNDEIDLLASTLNTMVDNIEQRTEELMVARAEALESSRLKSEFLSTISHELRTPLNAIMGYCDLMLAGMAGEFDEETQRMLERVDRSSNRLLRLIEDLLDTSRVVQERFQLDREASDLTDLLHQAVLR
ncbi:MAG: histidine kinase dimerization/phospho-acceptor domain-containing protein, partial [Chloroflexota bacterium]